MGDFAFPVVSVTSKANVSDLPFLIFRFLLECLEDLDFSLRQINSRLFVIRGQPANIFPRLFKVRLKLSTLLMNM